jgi:hypothetical protein
VRERELLHVLRVLVEIELARHPRALLVGLELDEVPRLRTVDEAGPGDRPADVAQLEVEVVLLAVGVEGGLVQAVGEWREERHPAQARPGLKVRQRRGRAHQVLALHLNAPGIAHAPDHRHVHLAGRIREFDDVAILFRGIPLGGRRSGTCQDERGG